MKSLQGEWCYPRELLTRCAPESSGHSLSEQKCMSQQQHCAYADNVALTSASCSLRGTLEGAPGTGLSRWTVAKPSAAPPTDSRTDSSDRPADHPACPAALHAT